MGIRVIHNQLTGHDSVFLQGNKIRVETHANPRVTNCCCCQCTGCPSAGNDGNRVFCCMHAVITGLTFKTGCWLYQNLFPGSGGGASGDASCETIVSRASPAPNGVTGPCGSWDLPFVLSSASNYLPDCRTIATSSSSGDSSYGGSCLWGLGGKSPSGPLIVYSDVGCLTQKANQDQYVQLVVKRCKGSYLVEGYVTAEGTIHDDVVSINAYCTSFRFFWGYVAAGCKQTAGQFIDVPNMQTISPGENFNAETGTPLIAQGGTVRLSMACLDYPCEDDVPINITSSSSYNPHHSSSSAISSSSSSSSHGTNYVVSVDIQSNGFSVIVNCHSNMSGTPPHDLWLRLTEGGVDYYFSATVISGNTLQGFCPHTGEPFNRHVFHGSAIWTVLFSPLGVSPLIDGFGTGTTI